MTTESPLVQNKEELLRGIRDTETYYKELWESTKDDPKKEGKRRMYDAIYSCLGLYGDCLQFPNKTKPQHVVPVVVELRDDLGKDGLALLRRLHKDVEDVLRVGKTTGEFILEIFPGSKEISSVLVDS